MGGGTTGKVALDLNRNYIGFEINETYLEELIEPTIDGNKHEFFSATNSLFISQ